ncbi:phosphatidylserine decarboxylase [Actinophytocola xanthii]|uniref:Phosphatidylserine decarboxylase proenzyme n=1 Tax=Actinophytocola xanthii TaxID=1912961 RepID=A0A1Q8C2N5_9PSEU|nr:phosphatidylserine decarboxylase [Actinophytocola xanthii]OLF08609.1 phosphatidylserine decarboxylase [Actinophytocola xanthii]
MSEPTESNDSGRLAHIVALTRSVVPPMHPAGRPFVAGLGAASLLARKLSRRLGLLGFVLTGVVAWFFREPKRVTPSRSGLVVAAADGAVAQVDLAAPPAELELGDREMLRISVFLSVFDVHAQRLPVSGVIERVEYKAGKFLSADLDKASEDNERNSLLLSTPDGHQIVVTQIAGLIARRIVCQVGAGEKAQAGDTYGLIRFGSRVDVYVPSTARLMVEPGQRTIGGETVLAELPER